MQRKPKRQRDMLETDKEENGIKVLHNLNALHEFHQRQIKIVSLRVEICMVYLCIRLQTSFSINNKIPTRFQEHHSSWHHSIGVHVIHYVLKRNMSSPCGGYTTFINLYYMKLNVSQLNQIFEQIDIAVGFLRNANQKKKNYLSALRQPTLN